MKTVFSFSSINMHKHNYYVYTVTYVGFHKEDIFLWPLKCLHQEGEANHVFHFFPMTKTFFLSKEGAISMPKYATVFLRDTCRSIL